MAKDPAILFYTSDFLTGTMTMTNEEVGKYIRLLCLQHQKKRLTDKDMLYICGTYVEEVYNKFTKDANNQYFNERLEEETIKRRNYSDSRRKNISKRYEPTYVVHMENENEDVNINIKEEKKMDKIKEVQKEYFTDLLPIDSTQQFIEAWNEWCDFRREIKKKLTKLSAKKQITFLLNQPNPIKCINQSIQNGWTGLFEVSANSKSKVMQNDYTYQELSEMCKAMSKDERIKFWNLYEIQPDKRWKLKHSD